MVAGLICNWLGVIWTYLLVTQEIAFGKVYLPLLALTGYPFWASLTVSKKMYSLIVIH